MLRKVKLYHLATHTMPGEQMEKNQVLEIIDSLKAENPDAVFQHINYCYLVLRKHR